MPADSQSFNSSSNQDVVMIDDDMPLLNPPVEAATDMASIGNNIPTVPLRNMPVIENHIAERQSLPSTSAAKTTTPRVLQFHVRYCDRIIPIDIQDTGTVGVY